VTAVVRVSAPALAAPTAFALIVSPHGEDEAIGTGTVTVTPPGAACPPSCEHSYAVETDVALRAAPAPGSFFFRWDGCPEFDLDATCRLRTTRSQTTVEAVFLPEATLVVGVTGNNASVQVSNGETCEGSQNGGAGCHYRFSPGSTVTLTPNNTPDSTLVAWSVPECPGTGPCTLAMDSRLRGVTATFSPTELSVIISNPGTVTSTDGRVTCVSDGENTCDTDYPAFTNVTLNATPAGDFQSWSGACAHAGNSPTCTLRLSGDDVVGAWFRGPNGPPQIIPARINVSLEVRKTGDGEGTVTSNRSRFSDAINCGAGPPCEAVFEQGENATLVAQPLPGSEFGGWRAPGNLCSTDRTCRFEVLRMSRLEVTFTKAGGGDGGGSPKCSARKVGGRRADRLNGSGAGDVIFGRGGNDRIRGLGGNDCLFGEAGKDVLLGGPGDDQLSGGAGADTLDGGPGRDRLRGDRGADNIVAVDATPDTIACGAGRDKVRADRVDKLSGCERVTRR
jgi:hemolysin type calcium-binding protein/List-Bact-rpt repeat protein